MQLDAPLFRGTLLCRYKRFFAEMALETGETVTAHCPNPGSMLGLAIPGTLGLVSVSRDPKRRLRHTLEMLSANGALVDINTARPNRVVAEALAARAIPELSGYSAISREVAYGTQSRIDFLLEEGGRPSCYVEVKGATLSRKKGLAEFPDSVTARGARHLAELASIAKGGLRAVMLFLVQREDCTRFSLAGDIDPAYAAAFRAARDQGVEALCYACRVSPAAIALDRPLPVLAA
jgi:sugar fermentation stimulation protein A